MLVEFRVGNYRSFREEQTLSLVASKDKELDDNCVDQGKLRLLKVVGIYGPNASGKSNLIKALSTMQQIIGEPAKPGEKLPVTPFKLDDKYSKKPSSFEVTFYHKDVRYQYGFTATTERIYDEWLYAYPKGRSRDIAQTWFERKFNRKTGKTKWNFGFYLKGEREKLKDRTINNILFLSTGAQWNNKQLTNVYEWFSEKLRIILPSERTPIITIEMLKSTEEEKKWKKLFYAYINEMMQCADFGIHRINIREEEIDLEEVELSQDMPEEIRNKILKNLATRIEFIHRAEPTGKDIYFSPVEESDGTIRFFELAGPWLLAILEGMTLLVDELEASLHPHLVRELIEFIQNKEISESGAQLVFATHDTTLLDPELFRRDQIWFMEKNEEGATQLYSMSDYKERKPRKGEAMQKGYLAGRYGAIPILEAFDISNG
ncbi:MAG: ATP-binding protein [Planctomycetes bacterium]|nr:ATP-binding protein [Planctomycetota bacterium]